MGVGVLFLSKLVTSTLIPQTNKSFCNVQDKKEEKKKVNF